MSNLDVKLTAERRRRSVPSVLRTPAAAYVRRWASHSMRRAQTLGSAGVLVMLSAMPVAAEKQCDFCGAWRPYAGSSVHSFDRLLLSADRVTLPGCSSTKVRVVSLGINENFGDPESSPVKPVAAELEVEKAPICAGALKGSTGYTIRLQLLPKPRPGSETIEITLYRPTSDATKRTDLAFWYAIRQGYNPCDEGSGEGTLICGNLEYLKADEQLNAEWRTLIAAQPQSTKAVLVKKQRKWIKQTETRCREEGEANGGAAPWPSAMEMLCKAQASDERTDALRQWRMCAKSGRNDCPEL